jgi:flagellar biosynthesis protein FliQ
MALLSLSIGMIVPQLGFECFLPYPSQSLYTNRHIIQYLDALTVSLNNQKTNIVFDDADRIEPMYIYRISYTLYTMIGVTTAIVVGLVVSFLTKPNNLEDIDTDLITPVIHRFLPSRTKHTELQTCTRVSHMTLSFIHMSH